MRSSDVQATARTDVRASESDRPMCRRDARRLRCLFIDWNVTYVTPTRNLLPEVLGKAFDLTCFGPGHQPDEIGARRCCALRRSLRSVRSCDRNR